MMKKLFCFIVAASLVWAADEESLPKINAFKLDEKEHEKAREAANWLRIQLEEIEKLRPGHTRGDLLKLFDHEGGIRIREKARFVYRYCDDIKVDVEFEIVGEGDWLKDDQKKDIIKKISKPYLDSFTAYD